jgi:hypothetical protein
MEIAVNFEFGDGDFERGFTQIKLQVTNAQRNSIQLEAQLPPAPELPVSYQIWKDKFDSLLKNSRGGFKKKQVTNLSTSECYQLDRNLCHHLHQWLNPIKLQLESLFQSSPAVQCQIK